MSPLSFDLETLEDNTYQVAERRAAPSNRPPRRESPRFDSRHKSKVAASGMQCRRNKRSGI